MRRNRHLIMGIGIGLIAGALLLQMMNLAVNSAPKGLYTEDQVKQAADDLGMKVYDGSQEVYTEQEWKEKEQGSTGPAATPSPVETPKPPAKPSTSSSTVSPPATPKPPVSSNPSASSTKDDASASKTTKSETPSSPVKFKIAPGASLTVVAAGLKSAGIINDQAAFVQKAKLKKLAQVIQPGTYSFSKGETFDSIAAKITTK